MSLVPSSARHHLPVCIPDEGRQAELCLDVSAIPAQYQREDIFYHLLGHHVGQLSGRRIPAILGLDGSPSPDNLKAMSAAVASSGGVELWHGIGVTPDAPTLDALASGIAVETVTQVDLRKALAQLTSGGDGPINLVALGTPHFSVAEFEQVINLLQGRKINTGVDFVITTSRFVLQYLAEQKHVGHT